MFIAVHVPFCVNSAAEVRVEADGGDITSECPVGDFDNVEGPVIHIPDAYWNGVITIRRVPTDADFSHEWNGMARDHYRNLEERLIVRMKLGDLTRKETRGGNDGN